MTMSIYLENKFYFLDSSKMINIWMTYHYCVCCFQDDDKNIERGPGEEEDGREQEKHYIRPSPSASIAQDPGGHFLC